MLGVLVTFVTNCSCILGAAVRFRAQPCVDNDFKVGFRRMAPCVRAAAADRRMMVGRAAGDNRTSSSAPLRSGIHTSHMKSDPGWCHASSTHAGGGGVRLPGGCSKDDVFIAAFKVREAAAAWARTRRSSRPYTSHADTHCWPSPSSQVARRTDWTADGGGAATIAAATERDDDLRERAHWVHLASTFVPVSAVRLWSLR